eukprot:11770060-Alexandrium_andersonii.AAC.1
MARSGGRDLGAATAKIKHGPAQARPRPSPAMLWNSHGETPGVNRLRVTQLTSRWWQNTRAFDASYLNKHAIATLNPPRAISSKDARKAVTATPSHPTDGATAPLL